MGDTFPGVGDMERKLRVCSYKISRKRVGAKNLVRKSRVLCGGIAVPAKQVPTL